MTVFAGGRGEFFRRAFTGYEWSEGSSENCRAQLRNVCWDIVEAALSDDLFAARRNEAAVSLKPCPTGCIRRTRIGGGVIRHRRRQCANLQV
ncbi:hypothetical protein HMPREF1051_0307 [Neisseria sicca VK64]|uniref:Uncharacterized protein n=1 Tax=Neisseria sicca VK64 TaxID=1095748 RepID=I2NWG9_NEISI|nr:hypothetical protein HMPREF1051_0307 [Neisseria sicca VK64]